MLLSDTIAPADAAATLTALTTAVLVKPDGTL